MISVELNPMFHNIWMVVVPYVWSRFLLGLWPVLNGIHGVPLKSSVYFMILTAVVFEVLHIPAPYLFLNPIFFDNQFNLNPFHIILCSPPSLQEKVCRFCMDLIADQGVCVYVKPASSHALEESVSSVITT